MGCGGSKAEAAFQRMQKHLEWRDWSEKFSALKLTYSEIKNLHRVFFKGDLDGSGTIDLAELLTIIDVEKTPFTKRVFSIFDDDESGEVDFGEFVLALWNYCTLSKVALGKLL